MEFQTAVRTCLSKYVTLSGRASRPEYWYFVLFLVIGQIVLGSIDSMLFGTAHMMHGPGFWVVRQSGGPVGGLFSLAMFLPGLAVAVRRLHDVDKSGWWLLIGVIPLIGVLVLLYFLVQPSDAGSNGFGPNPSRAATPPEGNPWT